MAKILGIQIAGFLFGLFMLYYSFLNYKRKEFKIGEFIFWVSAWAVFTLIAMVPSILDPLVKSLGFLRTLDLLVISGFLFLMITNFYTHTITRKNQKQVEAIVRELALKRKR